jgi:hypothetical protein
MALVSTGYYGNVVIADAGGNKSTLRYKLVAADIETADTDMATIITRLLAVTDGVVVGYNVGRSYGEDTSFFAPEGVQIENVALVSARIDTVGEKYTQVRIPAPSIGIFQQTTGKKSNVVDPTDADLVAYLNSFVDTTGLASISDGEFLLSPGTAGNVDGKRIHRGSRKG